MPVLHDIEQALARIEAEIAHVIELRKQYIETTAENALTEVDNKISGLKAWVEDIKKAILAGKAKIEAKL